MKHEEVKEQKNVRTTNYDSSKEEMFPLPDEEIVSYCEGKPCPFHHAERALETED